MSVSKDQQADAARPAADVVQLLVSGVASDLHGVGLGEQDVARLAIERHVRPFIEAATAADPAVSIARPLTLAISLASEGVPGQSVLLLPLGMLSSPSSWDDDASSCPRRFRYVPREEPHAE